MSLFVHLLLVAAGNPPIISDCKNSSCNLITWRHCQMLILAAIWLHITHIPARQSKGYFIFCHQWLKDGLRHEQDWCETGDRLQPSKKQRERAQQYIHANKRGSVFQKQQLWVCIPWGPILNNALWALSHSFCLFSPVFPYHHNFCSSPGFECKHNKSDL